MMDKENFGRFIAETRRNAGLTQKDMASKLHVTNSAVSKWERGLCYPDVTQMEALAQTLGLTLTQLLSCETTVDNTVLSPQTEENIASLLDIAKESRHHRRKRKLIGIIISFATVFLTALLLYFCITPNIDRVATVKYFGYQSKNGQDFVYMEYGDTLLCLLCEDPALFEIITSSHTAQFYDIHYRWDALRDQGKLISSEQNREILGTNMDLQGSAIGIDNLLGIESVWQEYLSVYPSPNGRQPIYNLRFYYRGNGKNNSTDNQEKTELLIIQECRGVAYWDDDEDGIVELFIWTKYDRAPYMRYDVKNSKIFSVLVDEVPDEVLQQLQIH